MKPFSLFIKLCVFGFSLSVPAPLSAQDLVDRGRDWLLGFETWDDLCQATDCDQFPVGYTTHALGPEVYYFPTITTMLSRMPRSGMLGPWGYGRLVERSADGQYVRSATNARLNGVSNCCHGLLVFYGLAEAFPAFRGIRNGNRMPLALTTFESFNFPNLDSRIGGINRSLEPFAPIEAAISPDQLSYNDDFWVLEAEDELVPRLLSGNPFRSFRLLSKGPMFHGWHISVTCDALCTFRTIPFAGSETETRPHAELRSMVLTGENMFLCTLEEVANGCDPSPDAMDAIPEMFEVLEDMFEAAQVFPEIQE